MGQSNSLEARGDSSLSMTDELDSFQNFSFLHSEIRRHSLTLRQLTLLNLDDLHNKIAELNALSSKYVDCNGKQLLFELKPGTDTHVLWKAKVRINCIKLDPHTQKIEKSRELYLKQFLQVYNTIESMQVNLKPTSHSSRRSIDKESDESGSTKKDDILATSPLQMFSSPMNASIIMDTVTKEDSSGIDECCICMESRSECTLPCTHSYCLSCIEKWNVDHKTCPICRDVLQTTDDTWVLEDLPNDQEVHESIQKSFFDLTR